MLCCIGMNDDYEVRRKLWESQTPVQISLKDREEALPLCMMMPRCTYLCTYLPKIISHFSTSDTPLDENNISFEAHGVDLKPYRPIGVLYDMTKSAASDIWEITVKASSDPGNTVKRDTVEAMFMQAIKEADYMKRKSKVMSSLKKEDHNSLWSGILHYKFEEFDSVNRRLMDDTVPFLHIPIRWYEQDKPFKQIPLKPLSDSEEHVTLLEAAFLVCPEWFDDDNSPKVSFISHGVEIPTDAIILYLAKNFCYPDNFVHICVQPV